MKKEINLNEQEVDVVSIIALIVFFGTLAFVKGTIATVIMVICIAVMFFKRKKNISIKAYNKGVKFYKKGQYDKALIFFEKSFEKCPENDDARVAIQILREKVGN